MDVNDASGGTPNGAEHLWQHSVMAHVVRPFLIQRTVLFVVVGLCMQFIPAQRTWSALGQFPFFDPWVRWDSSYYLQIAMNGYGASAWGDPAPFFPMYPGLVRVFSGLMQPPLAALLVANACLFGALLILFRMLSDSHSPIVARRAVWVALVFPTSYFFSAAYSESLYLLAAVTVFWAWGRQDRVLAAAAVFVGVLTRPVGVFALTLPFVVGWLLTDRRRKTFPGFVLAAIPAAAFLLSMHLLATGDAFEMFSAKTSLVLGGYERGATPPFWEVLWDEGLGPNLIRRLLNWGALGLTAAVAVVLLARRQVVLGLFTATSIAVPLAFHGSVLNAASMARYAAVAFPLFVFLGRERSEESNFQLATTASFALQIALALLFASWRWAE